MNNDVSAALKTDQFDLYTRGVTKLYEEGSIDSFWKELAAMHPEKLNIIDALSRWPPGRDYQLDTALIPVLAYLPNLGREDYRKLLGIIATRGVCAYSVMGLYIILCKRTIGRKLSPCPEPQ